jgi:hypothetical protein
MANERQSLIHRDQVVAAFQRNYSSLSREDLQLDAEADQRVPELLRNSGALMPEDRRLFEEAMGADYDLCEICLEYPQLSGLILSYRDVARNQIRAERANFPLRGRLSELRERFIAAVKNGDRLKSVRIASAPADPRWEESAPQFVKDQKAEWVGSTWDSPGEMGRGLEFFGDHWAYAKYMALANDAGICIDYLPAQIHCSVRGDTLSMLWMGDTDLRWIYLLYDLAWIKPQGSRLPDAARIPWPPRNDRAGRLPGRGRRKEKGAATGGWYAVIDDMFSASVAAIDVLLTICGGEAIVPASDGTAGKKVELQRPLPPHERARAYLERSARMLDEEALVFLVSRGIDCSDLIDELTAAWKRLDDQCMHENVSDNWWVGDSDFAGVSSIMRAVEWCKIGGFDALIEKDAEETFRLYRQAGAVNAPIVGECVFNLCRSKMGVTLHRKTLDILFAAIEDVEPPVTVPWEFEVKGPSGKKPTEAPEIWYSFASGYLFAATVLGTGDVRFTRAAAQTLLSGQRKDGSWSPRNSWSDGDAGTTAMAIHALALSQPIGWERATKRAAEWLRTAQTEAGSWVSTFLRREPPQTTVLALDAIELASGGMTTLSMLPRAHGNSDALKLRLHIDDIDSFRKARTVTPTMVRHLLTTSGYLDVPEETIQIALEEILSETLHKRDWGGEGNDLYTANVRFNGTRIATAFLLKGNGLRKDVLRNRDCGHNGDQLVRLVESPANLFVVQFVGNIDENVIKDIEGKVNERRLQGKLASYCVLNGQDTARLLVAYGKLAIPRPE